MPGTGAYYGKKPAYFFEVVVDPLGNQHNVHKVCKEASAHQQKPVTAHTGAGVRGDGLRVTHKGQTK